MLKHRYKQNKEKHNNKRIRTRKTKKNEQVALNGDYDSIPF